MTSTTRVLFFLLSLFSVSVLDAQFMHPQWAGALGGNGVTACNSIATDAQGNVYSVGSFSQNADFDPGSNVSMFSTGSSSGDIYVCKLNNLGQYVWAAQLGGIGVDAGYSVAVDQAGDVYCAGVFRGLADFDPSGLPYQIGSAGAEDAFVVKLSSAGNLLWVVTFGGTQADEISDIALDTSGNIYVAGRFGGTVDFDPGPGTYNLTSAGNSDAFVMRLTSTGAFSWAGQMGGASFDNVSAVRVNEAGHVFFAGYFEGVADLDPGAPVTNYTSAGGRDAFVGKLGNSGNLLWIKTMGGSNNDFAYDVDFTASGFVLTTGMFYDSVDFDPGAGVYALQTSGVSSDGFLQCLDAAGGFQWVAQVGGTNASDRGFSLDVLPDGTTFLTGDFQDTARFGSVISGPVRISNGLKDIFIARWSINGTLQWVETIGGTGNDFGNSLVVTNSGDIYLGGGFQDTVDFDPGSSTYWLSTAGTKYAFVSRYQVCQPLLDTLQITACGSYAFEDTVYQSGGVYTYSYTTVSGCDSIVVLDLQIGNLDALVSRVGDTLMVTPANAQSYQWVDCTNGWTPLPSATSSSLVLPGSGSYAVVVNDGICTDTSACFDAFYSGFDIHTDADVQVFPVPARDELIIRMPPSAVWLEAKLMTISGDVLYANTQISGGEQRWDISQLPAGVYLVAMRTSERLFFRYVVKV